MACLFTFCVVKADERVVDDHLTLELSRQESLSILGYVVAEMPVVRSLSSHD